MAARTSTQAGNWASGSTWVGGVAPVEGDTPITITHLVHVTANTDQGSSGASNTINVILNAGADLFIDSGARFRLNGCIQIANGTLTLDPAGGAILEFGDGGAGQTYGIRFGSATGQTLSRFVSLAPTGNHNTVQQEPGTGLWTIQRTANNASYWTGIECSYTDFLDGGTSASGWGGSAIEMNPSGATQKAKLSPKCTMTGCGQWSVVACPAARDIDIDLKVERPKNALTSFNGSITCSAATTGLRSLKLVARQSYVSIGGSLAGWSIDSYVIVYRFADQSGITGLPTLRKNILLLPRGAGYASKFGAVGETIQNIGGFLDSPTISSYVLEGPLPAGTGLIKYEDIVFGGSAPWEEDDFFFPQIAGSGGPWEYGLERVLMTRNSRGLYSGNVRAMHGSRLTKMWTRRVTSGSHNNLGPSGRAWFVNMCGADFRGFAGMVPESHSHLICAPAPLVGVGGWTDLYYSGSSVALASVSNVGTAAATSTTTRIDCTGKVWSTYAQTFLHQGGTKAVIIANALGTGPPVGQMRDVSNNGSNWFDVSAPWSLAPNTGTQFRLITIDVIPPTALGFSVVGNVLNGTCYAADGITQHTIVGVEGHTFSDPLLVNQGLVNLGSVTDVVNAGPQWVDPTRTYPTYASRYLGPAGLLATPPAWVNLTVYAIGDRVRAQTSTWYANEELWYRCIAPHTSATATDKPGSGASWYTKWEFDFAGAVSDLVWAGTPITDPALGLSGVNALVHLLDWLRRGHAPRNPAVRGARAGAFGGLDAGAVPFFGAVLDSTAPDADGGSMTLSPAPEPPVNSAAADLEGGSITIALPILFGSVAVDLEGGSLGIALAQSTVGMTGVWRLIRGVKTNRPLLLKLAPAVPAVLNSTSADLEGSSGTVVVGSVLDSAAADLEGGSVTMTVPILPNVLASSGADLEGGTIAMQVPIVIVSSMADLEGGSGTLAATDSYSADIATLISGSLGGDASVTGFYDYRHGKTIVTGVSNWADARGAGFGPALAQATTNAQPLDDGTTINFDGSNDILVSAAVAALSLDASRTMVLIAQFVSPASRFCLVIRNAGATRYMALFHNSLSAVAARVVDSVGTVDQPSGVALSANVRCAILKQQVGTRAMNTKCFNQATVTIPVPTGTVASENCLISLGGFNNSLFAAMKVHAAIVSGPGVYWDATAMAAINTWAIANHGSVNG